MDFITPAFAQAAPGAAGGLTGLLTSSPIIPIALMMGIMYFLMIRPQQQRVKDHRDLIASIKRGDTVVTSGGIIGKVVRVIGDTELQVEIAENVRVRVIRSTVSEVRTRGDVRDVDAKKALSRADNDDDSGETPGDGGKPANRAANTDV